MRLIIPEYRELWASGQIEISASPYYHPILPLLCNTESAWVASPGLALPRRFSHPEDARAQVSRAVERFKEVFGERPHGMWPSEGSVSEDIIPILAGEGINWIASDEEVLAQSLGVRFDRDFYGGCKKPEALYRPYRAASGGSSVNIVFRDHTISDLIGFVYSKWDPKNAVDDFVGRLHKVRKDLRQKGVDDGLVSIVLDGENAWEHYRNDGRDFLMRLYERLSDESGLDITTVGGYLESGPEVRELPKLHAGSWINHNFNIWIGHEEDNAAWDALSDARDMLAEYEAGPGVKDEENLKLAWEEIYIAEGSDWCWWYGADHTSENDREFDELFRKHIANIYSLVDKTPPDNLMIPIIHEDRLARPTVELTAFVSPTLDGEVTSYYEWLAAAYYDVSQYGGTMHRAASILSHIYYGFDLDNMFVRLDSNIDLGEQEQVKGLVFSVHFLKPRPYRIEVELNPEKGEVSAVMIGLGANGNAESSTRLTSIAAREIIEMAAPFESIEAKPKDEVQFFVTVRRNEIELEKWPYRGYISFTVPTENFEAIMWHV
jgi:alpha-amylase/alpha-mannosidase (GH57 family)